MADSGAQSRSTQEYFVYVGTYTSGERDSLYVYRLNTASGALQPVGSAGGGANPSFLALHPTGRYLYAVNEVSEIDGIAGGAVSAYTIDPATGLPRFLNQQPSQGRGPCHLSVDSSGRFVLVANYGGGSIAVLPVESDGRLGQATDAVQHHGRSVNPRRQSEPHPHAIVLDAANRYAFVPDLGLDRIVIYRFDRERGQLAAHSSPSAAVEPGAGPRHLVFHPSGRFAYGINEIDSTIAAFGYDAERGVLEPMQTLSTLPDGFSGTNHTAEIQVHPSGRFLYGSNRGHDSIAAYRIDTNTGRLEIVGHYPTQGRTPRHFALDPSGALLIAENQESETMATFRVDAESGRLSPTGCVVQVPRPVCIEMLPVR